MGVSPWNWWADVPVLKKKELYFNTKFIQTDAPKVKYRGIFLNDEAPARLEAKENLEDLIIIFMKKYSNSYYV
jgi:hypothetical protein